MSQFKLGINMAGAVSAGAYTAGVLDFLMEALDEWYAARSRAEAVPAHDVMLEVFSGASAGGMCAAIASLLVQEDFQHIHDTTATGTTNRFYESWVNRIDIRELLKTQDLQPDKPVVSLLDSTIIEEIADYALIPGTAKPRSFVSPSLTLFLSLTNLRGVPYSLNGVAPGSLEETTFYYADRLRFQTVQPGAATSSPFAKPLPLGRPNDGAWSLLRTTAMATGAFPVFLAPRVLTRDTADYAQPLWSSIGSSGDSTTAAKPIWPETLLAIDTLNVDGGCTDNDPFNLSHDYLASLAPVSPGNQNPREALQADRAVITVAPFPSTNAFDPKFDVNRNAAIPVALSKLFSVLVSQARFFGESLSMIMSGTVFSRFVIAPSDDTRPSSPALQCAALGAFGGFFERGFRAHDYQLGRRNCQQFLRVHFVLPVQNPVIKAGLDALGDKRQQVIADFKVPPPNGTVAPQDQDWIPIIPLCGALKTNAEPAPRAAQIKESELKVIVDLVVERANAVLPALLTNLPGGVVHVLLSAVEHMVLFFGKDRLFDALKAELGDAVELNK